MTVQGTGLIDPILTFVDVSGVPYASGTVTFYATGTQNLQNIYSDTALSVPLANPMTLNAAGRSSSNGTNTSPVYFQPLFYDYVLKDSTGTIIYGPETFNGSAWPGALQGTVLISPAASANAYANRLTTTINKAASGTAALFAGTRFDATTIGANPSTLTESATVYIEGAPSAGTSAYALHIGSANGGAVKFDGTLTLGQQVAGCPGRLTLTSGVPVTSSDVTGATTVYFTPYTGNAIGIFDGVNAWTIIAFSEISIALGTLTSGLPYDIFAFNNSGTLALEKAAWASATAIFGSGTYQTTRPTQNGVYVKSTNGTVIDATRRYLGTFYSTSTTQTEDSAAKRLLYNYYNRVPRPLQRFESTVSWTYTTATVRQANANGSTPNQVETMIGVQESTLDLVLGLLVNNTNVTPINVSAGIGEDSTTTYLFGGVATTLANSFVPITVRGTKMPTVGHHVYSWNEWSAAASTTTWFANVASVGSNITAGLSGSIDY